MGTGCIYATALTLFCLSLSVFCDALLSGAWQNQGGVFHLGGEKLSDSCQHFIWTHALIEWRKKPRVRRKYISPSHLHHFLSIIPARGVSLHRYAPPVAAERLSDVLLGAIFHIWWIFYIIVGCRQVL